MKFLGKYRTPDEMYKNEDVKSLEMMFPHGKPKTRREFLQAGAISFAATVTLPPFLQFLLENNPAYAAECATAKALPAFVTVNLTGGMAMSGNIIPHDEGRQMLASYDRLGLGSTNYLVNRTSYEFGNVPFFDGSGILAGIRSVASAETLEKTACIANWCESQDDSTANKFDMSGLAISAGLEGRILPNLGRRNSPTGIGQQAAFKLPPTPLQVSNAASIGNALGVKGALANLNNTQKGQLFSLINRLSDSQKRTIASASGGEVLSKLVKDATGDNIPLVSSDDNGTDPLRDPSVAGSFDTIWSTDAGATLTDQNGNGATASFAAMVYNALNGNAASVGLEMGGYDYHGNPRAVQTTRDFNAGRVIGQVLESAAAMGKPVFLNMTTDGAVGAGGGSQVPGVDNYTSDRGRGGGMYCFAYHPAGRAQVLDDKGNPDFQIGQFKPGSSAQAVDDSFLSGGAPELATIAAFANYTSFAGQPELFQSVVGGLWNDEQLKLVRKIQAVG